ncbi:MAG: mycothiol system anti-sigma-R factor [Actinomycetota bacterium]|jgi:mycothiol system anti-sigma-R factor
MKEHCRETLERAYLFLDGELLSTTERHEMRQHLEDCAPCFERVGLEREVGTIVARLKGCHPCPDDLRSRISALLHENR